MPCVRALRRSSGTSPAGDHITGALLIDPVIAEDGHTYERRAIVEWFRRRAPATSPLTHEEIGQQLKENFALRAIVEALVESSVAFSVLERAEWHLGRGKLLCERLRHRSDRVSPDLDLRAALKAFECADRLVADYGAGRDEATAAELRTEAQTSRDLCASLLDFSLVRDKMASRNFDVAWAGDAFKALVGPRAVQLTLYQRLDRGTHVRVQDDRAAVLRAFRDQEDVLALPTDWEESLGRDFVVENYDPNDYTYVLVRPDEFDEEKDNTSKYGRWWPFSVLTVFA